MNKGLGVLRRGMFRSAFLGPSQSSIWLSVIIGLAAREIFAPFTGHPFDFELWIHLGYYVSKGYDPYTVTNPIPGLSFPGAKPIQSIGYPPLWAFFQAGLYTIYSVAGINNRF